MDKIKNMILSFILKKYALGYLVDAYSKIKGYKTQLFTAICIGVYIGETLGQIPHELAEQLYTLFGGLGGMAFIQKLQRYQPLIDKTVNDVREGSK